jgi:hypothetical protein
MRRSRTFAIAFGFALFAAAETSAQQDTTPPLPPPPQPGEVLVTRPGYVACLERARFHEIMEKAARGDRDGMDAMLKDPTTGCFHLKPGLKVTLLLNVVLFVHVRPELAEDRPFWTVVEAVARPERPGAGGSG